MVRCLQQEVNLLAPTTTLLSGTTYYASQTLGCESATRLAVTPTVKAAIAAPTTTTAAHKQFCNGPAFYSDCG